MRALTGASSSASPAPASIAGRCAACALPRQENCRFFGTRAQAEAAAFRPCMKCRPEIAPGLSLMDSSRSLADTAARLIEHAVHQGDDLPLPSPGIARLGVTDRHLRRIFLATHGVGPLDYLSTQRLLLAKQLLTDTAQPVTQVALASGFASLRRFNAAFAERYRFNPSQLRREGASTARAPTCCAWPGGRRMTCRRCWAFLRAARCRAWRKWPGLTLRRTLGWQHQRPARAGLGERELRAGEERDASQHLGQPDACAGRGAAACAAGLRPRRRSGADRPRDGDCCPCRTAPAHACPARWTASRSQCASSWASRSR